MLKVTFFSTRRTNVGDDFVREGLRAVLDSLTPYAGYQVNKHDPEASCRTPYPEEDGPPLADKVRDADVVIQCGAPVYWNLGTAPGQRCTTAEWTGPFWYERVARVCQRIPVLNLAAGACQRYDEDTRRLLEEPECVRFIRDLHSFCRLTTVRDSLAGELHTRLGLPAALLPCASIHAWRRYPQPPSPRSRIALNFMPLGGHYDLDGRVDPALWAAHFLEIDFRFRALGWETALVAHDLAERDAAARLFPGRDVFYSDDYRPYLDFYATCMGGVLNRVHGAMLLAGSGSPCFVVGNDSRARMADEIGLPRCHVADAVPETIVNTVSVMLAEGEFRRRMLRLEQQSFARVQSLVGDALAGALSATGGAHPRRAAEPRIQPEG